MKGIWRNHVGTGEPLKYFNQESNVFKRSYGEQCEGKLERKEH